ncbi:aminoglycoside phosphotransferase family protein [Shimia ponticola]|uniref:aminoglycoside phosphotransferase family protein n=1 Tax=Shimia ponticola TaxID=2582893 RepID=UPI00164A92D7|nr:aminoglycoside phosphotransferase family protein [Shimia ponticola]
MLIKKLDQDIAALWPVLAREAGLDPALFHWNKRWPARGQRPMARVEQFVSDRGHSVVLKMVDAPRDPALFASMVNAQYRAAMAMSGETNVPAVLASHTNAQAVLMQGISGQTLFHALEDGEDHPVWLRRAGRWLAAFHRTGFKQEIEFKPDFNIRYLEGLLQDTSKVAEATEFEALARRALDRLPSFSGGQTVTAWAHGDANFHNILWDNGTLWGIDINKEHSAPIGYDVAWLLLHYAVNFVELDLLKPEEVVPQSALRAFFADYDIAKFDDPSIQTVLTVRLLNDWVRFPGDLDTLSIPKRLRYERQKAVVRNILGV